MKIQKIGMRTIKTVLAVTIAILVAQLLNLKSPFFAGIAAIMAMQASVSDSFSKGKERMYGTIFGAIIALGFSLIAPENIFFIGLGILIIIYLSNILDWKKSAQLSMIVFLSIILNYEEVNRVAYALNRTIDTFIGLAIGTLINYFIVPPKVDGEMEELLKGMYSEIIRMLDTIIWKDEYISLDGLKNDLSITEKNYNILRKDIKYNLHVSKDIFNTELMFELFEKIYIHLRIIYKIEKVPYIDDKNQEYLKRLFEKDLPSQDNITIDDTDIVYNYHLLKILQYISQIKEMLN